MNKTTAVNQQFRASVMRSSLMEYFAAVRERI